MRSSENKIDNIMDTKKFTIKDIARLAGVSAGTVDRVLHQRGDVSEKSRQRVQKVLDEIHYQPNKFAIALAGKKNYRMVCIIPQGKEGDYWSSVHQGIERAAHEVRDYNVSVECCTFKHADEESYKKACRQMMTERVDAVLIAPNFRETTLTLTNYLDEQGTPYLFIDFNILKAHPISYIGQDSKQSGYLAAKLLMKEYREGDELAFFLTGSKDSPAEIQMQRRLEGFTAYLAENHNRLILHDIILDKEDHHYNERTLDDFFTKHPDVHLGAVFNSRVYAVGNYLRQHPEVEMRGIVGYDLLPKNVECLKQSTVDYLIGQRPGLQGYCGIMTLCNHVVFKLAVPPISYMPIDLLMKENINYYFEKED